MCTGIFDVIIMGAVECIISSFIYVSLGSVEWQPYCLATSLLHGAPPKMMSALVLFITF